MAPGYRERYNQLRQSESQRNQLLEELLEENDRLKTGLEKTTHRLERDSDTVELYQQRSKEAIAKYETLQKLTDSYAYVCVLIDGDCMNFRDELVTGASVGGQDAAQLLRSAIADYTRGLGMRQDIEILLHIYVNVYKLLKLYRDSRLVHDHGDVDRFINGFNRSYSLLNIIDSGNAEECTEDKLCKTFKLNAHNMHCKHLILGGCSKDGYSRLLQELAGDENARTKITLLHGPPFSTDVERLSTHFPVISFPKVFRATVVGQTSDIESSERRDIITTSSNDINHKSGAAHSSPADNFLDSLNSHRSQDYVGNTGYDSRSSGRDNGRKYNPTESSRRPSSQQSEHVINLYPRDYFTDAPLSFIARNRYGERVDVPLTQPSPSLKSDIKQRKLCNDYCLGGHCQIFRCKHEHAKDLSGAELHALRDVARSVPCQAGLRCKDEACFRGHRCPVDPCGLVKDRSCRFPLELHDTDTSIVNKYDLDLLENELLEPLGVTNKPNRAVFDRRSPQVESNRNQHISPPYRNLTMTFDTKRNSISKKKRSADQRGSVTSLAQLPPIASESKSTDLDHCNDESTMTSSDSHKVGRSIKLEDRTSMIAVPMSPLKRTAEEAGYEPRQAVSPAADPRLAAQKRAKENNI